MSALIVLSPAVILAGAWRLGGVSALEDDLIYYLPVRQYIGERIAAGEWPLWGPLTGMGASIAADPQSGLWYPPTWLFALLSPLTAYPLTIVLHFALAGAGMYRFLRALHRDWRAALLGAVAFEFSGYLVAHRAHLTIFEAAAWLPWIFFGFQRFADSGRHRFWAVAALATGAQMLVQHIQVSLIGLTLLTGYVLMVLRPRRSRLIVEYAGGLALGILISSIQLAPTLVHLASTGRSFPSYAQFVENSWAPTSAVLLLFPMLFGSRTPNVWDQPWWGLSHFCEQSPYGTIVILVLAAASLRLVRGFAEPVHRLSSPGASGHELRWTTMRPWNREILFWWVASFVVLLLALGDYTPLPTLLFHIPFYRTLRVPARWILGWSMAMPILASAVVSAVLNQRETAERAAEGIRFVSKRVLPIAMIACLALMFLARWQVGHLEAAFAGRWNADVFFRGLRQAIRPGNPAIWWPIVLAAATGGLLNRWVNRPHARHLHLLLVVMFIDIVSVAAFVDVDTGTYARQDLQEPPPLALAIRSLKPQDGQRLLVPRFFADYERPIEVLWPRSNVRQDISTFHGYGPLSPSANRLLLRFMPWGSSEEMLALLRNTRLLQSLGVRFVAARSQEERGLMEAALWPGEPSLQLSPIAGTEGLTPVRAGDDLLWPVEIAAPGVYELALDAEPVAGAAERWFVRLETDTGVQIENTRSLIPEDLAAGPRRMRFHFRCDQAVGAANVRVKAERGWPLSAGRASFGRVASPPGDKRADPLMPAGDAATVWLRKPDLPGGIILYELRNPNPLLFWATRTTVVTNLREAVDALLAPPAGFDGPAHVVVEGEHPPTTAIPTAASDTLSWQRPAGHKIKATTDNPGPAFLVLNETYDAGWEVTVDGIPTEHFRVNAVVQGAYVPPGRHEVVWSYRPAGLRLGGGLTILGLVLLGVALLRSDRQINQSLPRTP